MWFYYLTFLDKGVEKWHFSNRIIFSGMFVLQISEAVGLKQHNHESHHFYLLKEQLYFKQVRGKNKARYI